MLMQVKKTPSFRIIRDSKNLTEMVKATIWYILKKSECTGNLSNTKRPSWRTTLHHLTKSKTLSRRFCITVKAYNQETCSWMEIQGFTTRCKALFTFQNRKIRLDFAKKPLKGPALCWKKKNHSTRWKQDELVWLWWEEKNVEKERKGSWSRTCHTVYPLIMCKSNKDFLQVKKLDSLRQPSQSPDLNSSVRDECRMTHKQATTSCRKGLAENLKGANTFGNVWRVLGSQVFSFFKY